MRVSDQAYLLILMALSLVAGACGQGGAHLNPVGTGSLPPSPPPVHTPQPALGGYAYGPDPAQRLDLRIVRPGAPLVILVHGGGWVGGDRTQVSPYVGDLAAQGINVANMDYRLTHYPEPVEDIIRVREWLRSNAQSLGLGTADRCILMGNSAGGNLVALAALTEGVCDGAITLYGIFDLAAITDPRTFPYAGQFQDWLYPWLGGNSLELLASASPSVVANIHRPAPMLIMQGWADPLVPLTQGESMRQSLTSLGGRVELVNIQAGHDTPEWNSPSVVARWVSFITTSIGVAR